MFNLFQGCNCPQKTAYAVLAIGIILVNLGIIYGLYTKKMSVNRNVKMFIVSLVTITLLYMLLNWLCQNNHSTIAWIITALPLITYFLIGIANGSCQSLAAVFLPNIDSANIIKIA